MRKVQIFPLKNLEILENSENTILNLVNFVNPRFCFPFSKQMSIIQKKVEKMGEELCLVDPSTKLLRKRNGVKPYIQ